MAKSCPLKRVIYPFERVIYPLKCVICPLKRVCSFLPSTSRAAQGAPGDRRDMVTWAAPGGADGHGSHVMDAMGMHDAMRGECQLARKLPLSGRERSLLLQRFRREEAANEHRREH
eukprot:4081273-Pyramimonas_sp.AAC.2